LGDHKAELCSADANVGTNTDAAPGSTPGLPPPSFTVDQFNVGTASRGKNGRQLKTRAFYGTGFRLI